ncbi:MAG TPA: 3-isopropylmalate dehydratase small subunit [Burkholderiales bacterium]|nr:3-isopropylmalate dehydratase small subunit [Burkholderiales bacterium]
MDPFTILRSTAAALPWSNVDTDMIIRVERCVRTLRAEMGRWAFEMARFDSAGRDDPEFPLNQEKFRGAQILVAGENFGCGSSREMAVWAIAGMGFRCVIAPSFGDIFYNNCFQNGVLAIRLPRSAVDGMLAALAAAPAPVELTVDLPAQTLAAPDGEMHAFEIDALRKKALLEGLDAIGVTLEREPAIAAWQERDRARRPWVWR